MFVSCSSFTAAGLTSPNCLHLFAQLNPNLIQYSVPICKAICVRSKENRRLHRITKVPGLRPFTIRYASQPHKFQHFFLDISYDWMLLTRSYFSCLSRARLFLLQPHRGLHSCMLNVLLFLFLFCESLLPSAPKVSPPNETEQRDFATFMYCFARKEAHTPSCRVCAMCRAFSWVAMQKTCLPLMVLLIDTHDERASRLIHNRPERRECEESTHGCGAQRRQSIPTVNFLVNCWCWCQFSVADHGAVYRSPLRTYVAIMGI